MNLNHLHLHVADIERSAGFYERVFGLKRHVWHGDILFMRDEAGMDLALAPGGRESFPSWFHFGFRPDGKVQVRALHRAALDASAPILEPLTEEDDFIFFRCADPDGYAIEIYWEPDGPAR